MKNLLRDYKKFKERFEACFANDYDYESNCRKCGLGIYPLSTNYNIFVGFSDIMVSESGRFVLCNGCTWDLREWLRHPSEETKEEEEKRKLGE